MSQALDIADLIRTRLLTAPVTGEPSTPVSLPTLGEDGIIVDRQKDIATMVKIQIAKAIGTGVTILWDGHAVRDFNASRPDMDLSYTIQVISKPVITAGAFPADDVMESIILRLWQWVPGGGHANRECKIQPGGIVADRSFLIYDLGVTVPASL